MVDMLFWEKQDWEPSGGAERLTLWADGRSEITVKRLGEPRKPKAGWAVTKRDQWCYYRKANPLPPDEARRKFAAAVAAGIRDLKTFPPGYADGSGTLVGVEVGGKLTETVVPMFLHPGEKDNKGSENHKRYLAVEKILGGFGTDAIEEPPG
jgi:hypothetical protein